MAQYIKGLIMDIIFFITLALVGIISAALSFIPSENISKAKKIILFVVILLCLSFQIFYGWKDKKSSDKKAFKDALYQDESLRKQYSISEDIKKLKNKEKKGLLTNSDYSLYLARYLESIDNTLKYRDGKNTREWITLYFSEVAKIPPFYSLDEWKESEKTIYTHMLKEIDGHFAARGTFESGMRPRLIEEVKTERERLLKAKESSK